MHELLACRSLAEPAALAPRGALQDAQLPGLQLASPSGSADAISCDRMSEGAPLGDSDLSGSLSQHVREVLGGGLIGESCIPIGERITLPVPRRLNPGQRPHSGKQLPGGGAGEQDLPLPSQQEPYPVELDGGCNRAGGGPLAWRCCLGGCTAGAQRALFAARLAGRAGEGSQLHQRFVQRAGSGVVARRLKTRKTFPSSRGSRRPQARLRMAPAV